MTDPQPQSNAPAAAVFGCAGLTPTAWERGFFREVDPLGFILFARNCETPDQIRDLVQELRETVGRDDAPVLIDQEGGRVARLRPPHWPEFPPAGRIGELAESDPGMAVAAARLDARLLAKELSSLGITVDCAPVLDLRWPGADKVIGDRAFGEDPEQVAALGRAFCDGLLAGGVLPVIKHMPGHGRALVDSHHELPVVRTPRDELEDTDFAAFRLLKDAPWGMTAHVVYTAIDPEHPATTSARVIEDVIRGSIGFDGLLLTDDLSMSALAGGLGERTAAALSAGCDIALHCNGQWDEMEAVAKACGRLGPAALRRIAAAEARRPAADRIDHAALRERLDAALARA